MWINKTNYSEKNQECSEAILDLMEHHDTIIPVTALEDWLYKHLVLNIDVTNLIGISVGLPDLPSIIMLHDDIGPYQHLEKFYYLYRRIQSLCKSHKCEMDALEALKEYEAIHRDTDGNPDLETVRNWMQNHEDLSDYLGFSIDYGFRNNITGESFISGIEGLDAQLSTAEFKGIIGFSKIYEDLLWGDNCLDPYIEEVRDDNDK
jgi:hypothetical protein